MRRALTTPTTPAPATTPRRAPRTAIRPPTTLLRLGRVSTDTVTIGYLYLDLDEVREKGFIDLNWGPQADHVQTIVDHINANGGINGRSIEVIPRAIDPLDAASAQAACLELTEDTEVFAVLGTLRRDEVLCYTEQHDTIVVKRHDQSGRSQHGPLRLRQRHPGASNSLLSARAADEALRRQDHRRALVDAASAATDVAVPALQDAASTSNSRCSSRATVPSAALRPNSNRSSRCGHGIDARWSSVTPRSREHLHRSWLLTNPLLHRPGSSPHHSWTGRHVGLPRGLHLRWADSR